MSPFILEGTYTTLQPWGKYHIYPFICIYIGIDRRFTGGLDIGYMDATGILVARGLRDTPCVACQSALPPLWPPCTAKPSGTRDGSDLAFFLREWSQEHGQLWSRCTELNTRKTASETQRETEACGPVVRSSWISTPQHVWTNRQGHGHTNKLQ